MVGMSHYRHDMAKISLNIDLGIDVSAIPFQIFEVNSILRSRSNGNIGVSEMDVFLLKNTVSCDLSR